MTTLLPLLKEQNSDHNIHKQLGPWVHYPSCLVQGEVRGRGEK